MEFGRRILAIVLLASAMMSTSMLRAAVIIGGPPPPGEEVHSIVFDQVGLVDPSVTFTFPEFPEVDDLTVSFGTNFVGQTLGAMHNSLNNTVPTPPMRLDPSGTVQTMFDLGSPTGIMLGGVEGNTMFTTPLAILFSSDVNYVSFSLGHLDENTPTLIQAFDNKGNSLGVWGGLQPGYETYSLVETDGEDVIAGVSIYVPSEGMDWEGFGLNSIEFSLDGDTDGGGMIPEPGTFVVWSLLGGCAFSAAWWNRRRGVKTS